MRLKEKIYRKCQQNILLNSIYTKGSYVKNKVIYWFKLARPILSYKRTHNNPVFLVFTPEHCNLGDHAIALAEKRMLQRMNVDFYEITGSTLFVLAAYRYLSLLNGACILVNGGGNIGNLWMDIERMNREIVRRNPNSNICFLPNSMCYTEDVSGRREMEITRDVFNAHDHLTIYAREEISYHSMRQIFRNVRLYPDMVLSLKENFEVPKTRDGCIICLRDDAEKMLTDLERKKVYQNAEDLFGAKVCESSTLSKTNVNVHEREYAVKNKLSEFSGAELVITDRLHGMIFCAITGTKCIVLNSRSPKMRGCYTVLEKLGYIKLSEADNIAKVYHSLASYPNKYENIFTDEQMACFQNEIFSIITEKKRQQLGKVS